MNEPRTFLEPLAGYAMDVVAKLRNRPFVPHSLTKLHNLRYVITATGARSAIEVGSFKGLTARRLSYLVEKVHTIEIDKDLHEIAKKRCADRPNVELILGDGSKVLADLAGRVDNAVIFLDGHFSGGQTGQGDEPEPVLKELDIIAAHLDRFAGLVVDDFRLFGVEPGWPSKSEVLAKLERFFPHPTWTVTILNDQYLVLRNRPAPAVKSREHA